MSNKDKVYESYDKIVDWYDGARSRELFEKPYLDLCLAEIKSEAKILDLGCGTGDPIGRYYIEKNYSYTGVDASKNMIALARSRFPQAKFVICDMRELDLKEKYDLVIAWHSFFHLPQDDQRKMFKTFENHIEDNGVLMFTSDAYAGEIWGDNGGENLYHASLSAEEYKKLLKEHHFKVIIHKVEDENCGDATIWVCKKTAGVAK